MVSNAGGKMLYEEQTNVTKDGWQQFLPTWCHTHLSSQSEVESTSPLLESGPACDLLLPMAYSRSDYASPRPSLKKPSSLQFRSLGSQWPCCREGLAGIQGEDRPPVEEQRRPTQLAAKCSHVSDPKWNHMEKAQLHVKPSPHYRTVSCFYSGLVTRQYSTETWWRYSRGQPRPCGVCRQGLGRMSKERV